MFAYLLLLAQSMPPLVLPPQSVPPAAMQPPGIVRGPQERGTTQSYISPDDYPAAAAGTGARGIVDFTLTIGPDGRVIGCNINKSSGSSALDAATCNILKRRAKFTPARDSNGQPTTDTVTTPPITWRLEG